MARIRKVSSFRRFGRSSKRSGGARSQFSSRARKRNAGRDGGERWVYFGSALLAFDDEVKEASNGNRYIRYQVMYNGNDDQEHTATGVIFESMENQIALAASALGYEVEDFDGLLQAIEESSNEEVPVVVSIKMRDDGYYNVLLCNPDSVRNGKSKQQKRNGIRKLSRSSSDDDGGDDGDDNSEGDVQESKPSKVVIRKLNKPIPQEVSDDASGGDDEEEVKV